MLASGWIQLLIYLGLLLAITKPLGVFLFKVLNPAERTFLDPVLKPVERLLYKLFRVDPLREQSWKGYGVAMLVFSAVGIVFTYAVLRLQQFLPWHGALDKGVSTKVAMTPDLAFNTAASFTTNTNWQSYGGESTMSYFSQMVGLTFHNFMSAAVGICVAAVVVRGIARDKAKTIGNFWADLVRVNLYLLMPLCIVYSVFLVSQGMIQNFKDYETATVIDQPAPAAATPATLPASQPAAPAATQPVALADASDPGAGVVQATQPGTAPASTAPATEPASAPSAPAAPSGPVTQTIAQGPMASQIAIKMLGTNGGGFTNANAAHPYENPTPLSNFIQMLSIFAIPSALTYYLGRTVKKQAHGWAVWAAMAVLFIAGVLTCWWAESAGNPVLSQMNVAHVVGGANSNGNMEGKEVRFGVFNSALFATITTDASCGAVNSMHDSFTPIGGMVPLFNMHLGEVVFGGVGAGLYGMLVFVVIAIFIAGLMVGRTPEYLGKKIESYDIKAASLAILILTFSILCFSAWASVSDTAQKGLNNTGPHGFSEMHYAFTSATANNGSAFAGLAVTTAGSTPAQQVWWNTTLAVAMLLGRFIMIVPILALAGNLAKKKRVPSSAGSFPVTNATFVVLLVGTVLIVGALSFLPALSLGPVVEHFMMYAKHLY